MIQAYQYSSILRILYFKDKESLMIDIDTSTCEILSVFDGEYKFDLDFITSFKKLIEQRATGFKKTEINSNYTSVIKKLLCIISIERYSKVKPLLETSIRLNS